MNKKAILVFIMVFTIGCAFILPQGTQNPDELIKKLETEKEKEKPKILVQLAEGLMNENPPLALDYASQALESAQKQGDTEISAQAHYQMALAYFRMEKNGEGLKRMELAQGLFTSLNNRSMMARTLGYSGIMLSELGRLTEAIEKAEQALAMYRELGDQKGIAAATNNLGSCWGEMGDYHKALQYNFESLKIEESLNRPVGIANNLNCIGNSYSQLDDHLKAREYYQRARTIFHEIGNVLYESLCVSNIGATLERSGDDSEALAHYVEAVELAKTANSLGAQINPLNNMGVILIKRSQYAEALQKFEASLEMKKQLGRTADLINAYHNIAEVYKKMGQYQKSLEYLDQALLIAKEVQSRSELAKVYRLMANVQHQIGNEKQAFLNLESYIDTRETILDEERNKAIAEMEVRYQSERRENELVLVKRDQALKSLELEASRQRFYIAVLMGLMAMVALFWLGKRYRRLVVFWRRKTYVGSYQIGERLGGGGMGEVFKAWSIRDAKMPVALKLLREEYARDPLLRKRFLNESKVIDQLNHPNIVKVLERGETNDRLYMAMEFIEGKTLAAIIREQPRLPLEFCMEVMNQLLDAVEVLHQRGILHRDLKPENVMVSHKPGEPPQVKLMDFDLARDVRLTPLTRTGELLGTLPYMAPERISDQVCTEAGDIYALGAVFYEMLTGETPFPGDTPVEIMKQILDSEPIPVNRLRGDVSQPLAHLVTALLGKDMQKRPDIKFFRASVSNEVYSSGSLL